MADTQRPLTIKDFQKANADSPHVGHALLANLDVELFPGALKAQKRNLPQVRSANTTTFTADASTDICTGAATLVTTADDALNVTYRLAAVYFTTTGTLPAGLSPSTVYYLIYVTDTTFKVATTQANANAGTAINITGAGTGVHTIKPIAIGTFKHIRRSGSYTFALDSNGRVWHTRSGTGFTLLDHSSLESVAGTISNAAGNGMEVFKNSNASVVYLIVFRNNAIDTIPITDTAAIDTPVWTDAWQSLNSGAGSGNRHFALLGQDNIIYFTDDKYTGSIQEKAGQVFLPSDVATYTYNNRALTLAQNEVAYCLEELGATLLVGGSASNKIYPWDRVSNSYNLPLLVPEYAIYEMRNLGNTVYIFAGNKGNIYITQGTYVKHFKALSPYVTNNSATTSNQSPVTWGGTAVRSGAILFGMGTQTTINNGTYIIYPDGRWLMDSTPWSGGAIVYAILTTNDFYYSGYAGQIDLPDSTRVTAAIFESALYKIANKTQKASFSEVEVQLARPVSGSNIIVGWRTDLTSSFTTLTTFATDGTSTSYSVDGSAMTDIENLQIQISLGGTAEITEVRLYP